jgi:hypothetical protein
LDSLLQIRKGVVRLVSIEEYGPNFRIGSGVVRVLTKLGLKFCECFIRMIHL